MYLKNLVTALTNIPPTINIWEHVKIGHFVLISTEDDSRTVETCLLIKLKNVVSFLKIIKWSIILCTPQNFHFLIFISRLLLTNDQAPFIQEKLNMHSHTLAKLQSDKNCCLYKGYTLALRLS